MHLALQAPAGQRIWSGLPAFRRVDRGGRDRADPPFNPAIQERSPAMNRSTTRKHRTLPTHYNDLLPKAGWSGTVDL